jgi:uncharacterized protein (UPF0548 family)
MFLLREPSVDIIQRYLAAQSELSWSYSEVGASRTRTPAGYSINHYRCKLGTGGETFLCAVEALHKWEMYNIDWARLCWRETPISEGAVVAVLAHHFGFWSLNPCRIIYVLEEEGVIERKGFAFGTLPGHAEQGEERFAVEWDHLNDSVWYDLFSFARPKQPLAKMGFPLARLIQRRFARDSQQAMITFVWRQHA